METERSLRNLLSTSTPTAPDTGSRAFGWEISTATESRTFSPGSTETAFLFENNDVYELLGNGDGTFAPARLVIQNLTNPAVADLNHDGRPDVVDNRNPAGTLSGPGDPQFRIFLCQQDGSFTLTNTYAPYTGQESSPTTLGTAIGGRFPAFIGDFNGDGQYRSCRHSVGQVIRLVCITFSSCSATETAPLLPPMNRISSTLPCRQ